MLFTIICILFIIVGIYAVVLVATDEYRKNKKNSSNGTDFKSIDDGVKGIEIKKDKDAYKYFLLAFLSLACIYTSKLSNLFLPLFSKVYYGNLNGMFLAIATIIIWAFELVAVYYFAKNKFGIYLFSKKNKDVETPSLLKVLMTFLITFIPIMIISALLGWNLKIVDDFGQKIESIKVTSVISQYVQFLLKILWTTIIIVLVQEGMEKIVVTKAKIPWGGIVLMLTFGILELFLFDGKFKIMYLLFNLIFGVIYLLTNKSFSKTYWISYILYIL